MIGSHMNITHIDEGALDWLRGMYSGLNFLDIGCGPMGMVDLAYYKGHEAFGIDADKELIKQVAHPKHLIIHDLREGPCDIPKNRFDIIWCVEFVEHFPEQFIPNWINTLKLNINFGGVYPGILVMTHATGENQGSHVNCQPSVYWKALLSRHGFRYEGELTNELKAASTMKREFMKQTGMLFTFNGGTNHDTGS